MADDSPRALLCLTEGESSLFRVKPAGNTDIIDLKDLIKEQGINSALRAILAKDLILWKVRMTMVSDNTTNSLLQVDLAPPSRDGWKGLTGKDAPGSVKLEALNTISDYWPATTPPNPKHLHILIECPSGERCVHRAGWISLTVSRLSACLLAALLAMLRLLQPIVRFCFRSRCIPITAAPDNQCGYI